MTYKEALEKGVEKWEKLSIFQSALNAGDTGTEKESIRLLLTRCSLCDYHYSQCGICVLYRKKLCVMGGTDSDTEAYWVFRNTVDNNEKLTAARQIRDALREELRRVTEEEANNAEERHG
jgi:hypothetical protein